MLVELSVVEQRYLAVREALDSGATITDIARRYGVDRRTVHRWLVRYAAGGLGVLVRGKLPNQASEHWRQRRFDREAHDPFTNGARRTPAASGAEAEHTKIGGWVVHGTSRTFGIERGPVAAISSSESHLLTHRCGS
jgi:transposase-like protein